MVTESFSLDKKSLAGKQYEYDIIYNKGIELLQKYCGGQWTDYNHHDPGITILEHLCYALTELYYKSTFPVEDYFTEVDKKIPYDSIGLFQPEKILPNGCTTINDLRRALFDDIEEVGNIWIEPVTSGISGLYTIFADIADEIQITDRLKEKVHSSIISSFTKYRNLGEDVADIIILDRCMLDLCGDIEVRSTRGAGELISEIYSVCTEYIAQNLRYRSVKELHSSGMELPQLFDGPLLKNGIIPESDLNDFARMISIAEMVEKIKKIDGVVEVHSLFLKSDNLVIDDSCQAIVDNHIKTVRLPQNDKEIMVRLKCGGVEITTDFWTIQHEVKKNLSNDPKYPDYIKEIRQLYPLQCGENRVFDNYYSIQNHFPVVYGIANEGLPKSESPERKAKARQLKAYLWLFEQIMADFGASVQNIRTLFSVDGSLQKTYFSKYLDNTSIPDIEELYLDNKTIAAQLEKTLNQFDPYTKRQNDILDYVLGMYGIEFSQHTLRHFKKEKVTKPQDQIIIDNKLRYVRYVPLITKRLTKGYNYLEEKYSPENIAGLELQLHLRIGNDPEIPDESERMFFIEHILLRPYQYKKDTFDSGFYNNRISAVFPGFSGRYKNVEFRSFVMQLIEKNAPAHIFIEYIWCNENQWAMIEPLILSWKKNLTNSAVNHDRASVMLTDMLIKCREVQ